MVKKGKEKAAAPAPAAPAASTSKKPPKAKPPPPPREDDFIVFSNASGDPKPKRAPAASKAAVPEATEPEGPPKPTVKQIVGGASWTGKLPVNLLSEHCQKQKWDKPSYDNVSRRIFGSCCT